METDDRVVDALIQACLEETGMVDLPVTRAEMAAVDSNSLTRVLGARPAQPRPFRLEEWTRVGKALRASVVELGLSLRQLVACSPFAQTLCVAAVAPAGVRSNGTRRVRGPARARAQAFRVLVPLPGGHLELGITVSQAASEALEATVKLTPRVDAEEKQGAPVQLVIPGQRAGSVSAGQSLTVGPVALDQEWSVQVTWVDKLEYELPLLLKADLEETADEDS